MAVAFFSYLITLYFSHTLLVKKLEYSSLNARFKVKQIGRGDKPWDIVIVSISDQAYSQIPERWPWPRRYYAQLIENLNRAGARAIGIDVIFDIPTEDDALLSAAIEKYGNVVLSGRVAQGEQTAKTFIGPASQLQTPLTRIGVVNLDPDVDGFTRRYWPVFKHDDSLHPSLALALYLHSSPSHRALKIDAGENRLLLPGGNAAIPLAADGTFLLDFFGPAYTLPYQSFDVVLDDKNFRTSFENEVGEEINTFETEILPQEIFKNKIVLVGATMEELHDFKISAFDQKMPGVEFHATALQCLIDQRFLHQLDERIDWFLQILLALIAAAITYRFKALKGFLILLLAGLTYLLGTILLFVYAQWVIQLTAPIITLVMVYMGQVVYLFIIEQNDKKMITGMFSQYVPGAVVKELIEHPEKMKLGGERRYMTVLFSDVEGFTSISESLSPEELVSLLNEYLSAMTELVFQQGGIIDKYEGDAIMAEFGIPLEDPRHAFHACQTALEMQVRLKRLREKWKQEGRHQLRARIGISTGEMSFGNMGSHQIFDYTVMGDRVNLGSRLEGANKQYGTHILMSHETYQAAENQILAREMDLLVVKGKSEPIKIYNLLGLITDPERQKLEGIIQYFNQGVAYYRQRRWEEAIQVFKKVCVFWPDDPASLIYIGRSEKFKQTPPPPDWIGTFVMETK